MEVFEVYKNGSNDVVASLPDAIFQTLEDAEAFASYKALLEGGSYTICQRKVAPVGIGSSYRDKLKESAFWFSCRYNIETDEVTVTNTYPEEGNEEDKITETTDLDPNDVFYGFDIIYTLKDEDKTYDDIKAKLLGMIHKALHIY